MMKSKVLIKELDIINDYKNGFNLSKLVNKYGGRRITLRKILFKYNLIESIEPKRKKYFEGKANIEVRNQLLERYKEEKNLTVLSKEFDIPKISIWNLLKKECVFNSKYGKIIQNEKVRKYPVNEDYFNNIDCEEKAYFLGILYADGTNSLKKTEIKLSLQEDDLEILIKLNNLLQPTKPILFKPKISEKHKNQWALIINSKIVSYKLNELGIVPNKTFKVIYPQWLDKKLNRHFIRGYFDGDGCVTFDKYNRQLCFSFTGTENIVLNIENILINKSNLNNVKLSTRFPERNDNIRSLCYSGNGNSRNFYDFIYNDATIYMKRKKDKFEKHLNLN